VEGEAGRYVAVKTLLRSCFIADPVTDRGELLVQNYHAMVESGLGFDTPEDNIVWTYIQDFFKTHGHVPEVQTMQSHFAAVQETDVVDRIERLAIIKARTRGDFLSYLEEKATDRRNRIVIDLAKEMAQIIQTGIEVKDPRGKSVRLHGAIDAIRHVLDRSHDIVAPTLGSKLSGNLTQDEQDFLDRYDRIKADPVYGVGQHCGIGQIDATLNGAKRYELWLHTAFAGGLKCVTGDTQIWDVSTGLMCSVKELYEAGTFPTVHGLDTRSWKMRTAQVSHIAQQGVRPVWKVTSEFGKEIRVSGNHPFLTPRGWVNAEELQSDDWVAVPSELPNDLVSPFTDEEVEVLGYLLGDGRIRDDISLSNGNPRVLVRFMECLNALGYRFASEEVKYPAQAHYTFSYARKNCVGIRVSRSQGDQWHPWVSRVRELLDRLGLYGTDAGSKFLPSEMWRMTDAQVWVFLSALWSTDGRVAVEVPKKNRKPRPVIWIVLKSRPLIDGISRLLQRVGVPSSVRPVTVRYRGQTRTYWQVEVRTNQGKRVFLEKSSIVGKELEVRECLQVLSELRDSADWCPVEFLQGVGDEVRARSRTGAWHYAKWAKRRVRINRDTLERLAVASKNLPLITQVRGQVRWERVKSERDGEEMTYDLAVPEIENFVANGFVTHNSSFALHWAYVQAVYYRASSCYFSLEMPYLQCRNLIYTMHSAHEKFGEVRQELGVEGLGLDYERVRDGKLGPNEERFLKDYVVPDFNRQTTVPAVGPAAVQAEDYGDIHIRVADPDKNDFTINDLRSQAELTFSKTPFRIIFVDHVGLMAPRGRYSSTTEKLNEIIRDLKRFAMSFNRGMGVAVVGLFQISREGYRSAEKSGGRYNLTHLSYANEAERSSDVVTATWIDEELRNLDKAIFQCLKSRDQKPFNRIPVRIEFSCRRFLTSNVPIEEVDQQVRDAKGGDDEDKKTWKKKKQKDEETPDLEFS